MIGVVILPPLLGVRIESAVDLWFSLHLPLPATFSLLLWQALISILSSVTREREGRGGAIHWEKKDSSPAEKLYFLFYSAMLHGPKKKHSWNSLNQLFCLIKIMD